MKLMTEKFRLKTDIKQVPIYWPGRSTQSEEVVERKEKKRGKVSNQEQY